MVPWLYVNICRELNFFDEILNLRHKGSLMGNAFLSVFFHPKSVKSSICMHFACHTLANMEGDANESGLFFNVLTKKFRPIGMRILPFIDLGTVKCVSSCHQIVHWITFPAFVNVFDLYPWNIHLEFLMSLQKIPLYWIPPLASGFALRFLSKILKMILFMNQLFCKIWKLFLKAKY